MPLNSSISLKNLHFYIPIFLLCFLLFEFQVQVQAQEEGSQKAQSLYTVDGSVLDRNSWIPISNVSIINPTTGEGTTSNKEGRFSLSSNQPILRIELSAIGYFTKEIQINSDDQGQDILLYLDQEVQKLEELIIRGFNTNKNQLETPATVSSISSEQIDRFGEQSLVSALNTRAGVRMEQRSPASFRISMRGSLLRSPFDVRNVKIYWNDIPFTDATGTTFLHLIDPQNIANVELIKGPASSLYGAGYEGAILIQSKEAKKEGTQLNSHFTAGQYGLIKAGVGLQQKGRNGNTLGFQYNYLKSDGYRDHTEVDRKSYFLNASWKTGQNGKGRAKAFLAYTDLFYELPGGLTAEQFEENPQQARPNGFSPGSEIQNASLKRKAVIAGIQHRQKLNKQWSLHSALTASQISKDNPFNTNYKLENQLGFGLRSRLQYKRRIKASKLQASLGGEYQQNRIDAKQFGNDMGNRDTLMFADFIVPRRGMLFGQANIELPKNWIIDLGASLNYQSYQIDRIENDGFYFEQSRKFKPVVSPRFSILKSFKQKYSTFAAVSLGFSPPGLSEFRTSEGSINTNLEAEKSISYEVGVKGQWLQNRLKIELSAYYLTLNDAIVSQADPISETNLFFNAGSTQNPGLELQANYNFIKKYSTTSLIKKANIGAAYTFRKYKFNEYTRSFFGENVDYSDKPLTGIAPNILNIQSDIQFKWGLGLQSTYLFTDAIPLNDANTVHSEAYHLLQFRLYYQKEFAQKFQLECFVGSTNTLDQKYSLGNDLNPFGSRYFQTAAPRTFYGGLRLNWKLF